ncbi:carboxymuconolactone decarboxylase family protein [Fusibacter paucivorans]|uniref:Carboxymuconolactone decarboxylase family protein n=1 Tax=Fusibacter paucivorans TaxID=76009 RepID=A0ABS5PJX4_9FIRM|nr:carboxymuconolactone decarboxylase family protein [Fusibacter paucivorans]MBS7525389.1 carboxymuconolactone decarboxylase family protein [Fusibacter paucivorans]
MKFFKRFVISFTVFSMVIANAGFGAAATAQTVSENAAANDTMMETEVAVEGSVWTPLETTARTEQAKVNYDLLFGDLTSTMNVDNPEYVDSINNFIYGDIFNQSDLLDFKQKEMIALVSLTTNRSYELLKLHAVGAVKAGLTPEEVMEAVYHCTPYVGIATTYEAVYAVTEAFKENEIEMPLTPQTIIEDDMRYTAGNEAQAAVFGAFMRRDKDTVQDDISVYVTEWCFGDFYTRGTIDLETREMLTMCILANTGADQLRAHVFGTRNVGFSQEAIMAAITQCMPYMWTPLTLSAVSVVNDVFAPEDSEAQE